MSLSDYEKREGKNGWEYFVALYFLRINFILLSMASGLLISSCSIIYHHYPFEEVRNVKLIEDKLSSSIANNKSISMRQITAVTYDDKTSPIWILSYVPNSPKHYVLITAGIHGNEPSGVEAIVEIIKNIGQEPNRYTDVAIDFIPMINPWGWTRNVKWNGDAIDINRKFISIDTQEAIAVKMYILSKKYDLTIDLHEDGRYDGFYILTYDNHDLTKSQYLAKKLKEKGIDLRIFKGNEGYIHVTREKFNELNLPTFAYYLRLNNTNKAYIFETPYNKPMQERVDLHKYAVNVLINLFFHSDLN